MLTFVNENGYKPLPNQRTHKLTVEFMLDPVPGAWAQPEDLMRWIAQHSYVQSVTLQNDQYEIIGEGIRGGSDILGTFDSEEEAEAELQTMYDDPFFDPGNWQDIIIRKKD